MNSRRTYPIVNLMGATAMGKTDVAIELCKTHPVRIISVDSALIYKGMDIGTAKPTLAELEQAPHQLINIIEPDQNFSAADFVKASTTQIEIARQNDQLPLLVGGSMFYFHALLYGLDDMPEANLDIRKQLTLEAKQKGWQAMHQQLQTIDPSSAEKIHPNHSQRIIRALEVFHSSGKTMSDWQQNQSQGILHNQHCVNFAMSMNDRSCLHQRIEKRFHSMLNNGFEQEVCELISKYHSELNAFKMVGYRQVIEYINDKCDDSPTNSSYDQMAEKGIIATRQLAKRQMTWLRQWKSPLCWLKMKPTTEPHEVAEYIRNIVF